MSLLNWIKTAAGNIAGFVNTEIAKIEGDAQVVATIVNDGATAADNLVNGLKNWLATPAGQTIEQVIENIPGIGPYAADVLKFLPQLVVDLNWAKAEFTKSPAQIVQDGITAAVNAPNAAIKSTNLSVLQAHLNSKLTELAGAPVSIQASLTQANAVHVVNNAVAVPVAG